MDVCVLTGFHNGSCEILWHVRLINRASFLILVSYNRVLLLEMKAFFVVISREPLPASTADVPWKLSSFILFFARTAEVHSVTNVSALNETNSGIAVRVGCQGRVDSGGNGDSADHRTGQFLKR